MSEVIVPYKAKYLLVEWWEKFSKSAAYKRYSEANPKESERLAEIIELKIDGKPYGNSALGQPTLPNGFAKTFLGESIVMALCTFSGGHLPT